MGFNIIKIEGAVRLLYREPGTGQLPAKRNANNGSDMALTKAS